MIEKSYRAQAIVLKKTKLKETDLIVTLMSKNGQAIRAVAKGARKPSSSFSSKLEPGSVVDVLVARGRGDLGIIQEVSLIDTHELSRVSIDQISALSPSLELLARACQSDISVEKLYALTEAFLDAMVNADATQALALGAANMLKANAFLGYRPCFDICVCCGKPLALTMGASVRYLSVAEGGSVCQECCTLVDDSKLVSKAMVSWLQFLLMSSFAQIKNEPCDISISMAVYEFIQSWIKTHGSMHLKSLDFLMTCGLYVTK